MLHRETITYSWNTPEYEFKKKRKDWYWIVGAVAIGLIVLAIILQNYLFAFLVGIGSFLMIHLASKEPLSLPVEISEQGIKIYKEHYGYEDIFYFWITINKKEESQLLFLTAQKISPVISVIIDERIDLMELREYLLNFLKEKEIKESLTDRFIDKIGF